MTWNPFGDSFEEAERAEEERMRYLSFAAETVKERCKLVGCPVVGLYILPQQDVHFRAWVFFEKDLDLREGWQTPIEDAVYEELESCGRGKRGEIRIAFEFDSDENIKKKYEGNYYVRINCPVASQDAMSQQERTHSGLFASISRWLGRTKPAPRDAKKRL